MNTEEYNLLLKRSKLHLSVNSFIDFVRENNEVILEDEYFILIKNAKYHSNTNIHYTGFLKSRKIELMFELSVNEWRSLQNILMKYKDLLFYSNPKRLKTVDYYHFHLCTDYPYQYLIDNNLI